MFQWKVYIYKNVNGKEEKIEREFNNPQEFQSFAQQNNLWSWGDFDSPKLALWEWANLQNYFEDLLDRRLGVYALEDEYLWNEWTTVNLQKYENALQQLEYQKQHKDEHVKRLKETLQKLKEYKKKFKEENDKEMLSQIEEDIKKVQEEIATIDK